MHTLTHILSLPHTCQYADGRRVEVKAAVPRNQQAPHPATGGVGPVVNGKIFIGGTVSDEHRW
jgi:hypothetical protein